MIACRLIAGIPVELLRIVPAISTIGDANGRPSPVRFDAQPRHNPPRSLADRDNPSLHNGCSAA